MIIQLNPVKTVLAKLFSIFGIYQIFRMIFNLKTTNKYIRIVNYHSIPESSTKNFEDQIKYFKLYFQNINIQYLEEYFEKGYLLNNKPGIIISFDDGFLNNYEIVAPILEKFGFTGYFFISSDYISQNKKSPIYSNNEYFMTWEHLRNLKIRGHVIGCHTKTHHRMNLSDGNDILEKEIIISKKEIDTNLFQDTNLFCWVGGEEDTYTKNAMEKIKQAGYKYVFTTMAGIITQKTDPMFLLRTNIESDWPMDIVKFQIWGPMDIINRSKRKRVYKKIMD